MTVHIVDATLFFSATSGGVRRYLLTKHDWFRRRAAIRHTLVVPGPYDAFRPGGIVEFKTTTLLAGYRVPLRVRRLRALFARLGPDVIEAADPYQVGWQVARHAETSGVPAVAFCHSDLVALFGKRFGAPGGQAAAAYLRRLYAHFTSVLAPSRVVADRLRDAGIEAVQVLPLGVDANIFSPIRRDPRLRERLGIGPNPRILTFAGRLAPEKNLSHLYQMIDRLGSAYHLLLIGGERSARPAANVSILPYQADPCMLAALLAASDALVHAGTQETFGLIALEAMACAVPVVCYDGGALAEIVAPEFGALATPGRRNALADTVVELFERGPVQRGQAARRHVLEQYTWDAVFGRQLKFYGTLLGRRVSHANLGSASRLAPE